MSRLQRILWAIGGFDADLLLREGCRSVRPKYSAMGCLVLWTAMLAACSGGYALWSVFGDLNVALPLSLLWGGFILSLDRLLISATRKTGTLREYWTGQHIVPPYHTNFPLIPIVVRCLLACGIGFVVAKPIEVRLMRPWVQQYEYAQGSNRLKEAENDPSILMLRKEIEALTLRIGTAEQEVVVRRQSYSGEADGTDGTKKYGVGEVARKKEALLKDAERTRNQLVGQLESKNREYQLEHKRVLERPSAINKTGSLDESFIKGLRAIHELARAGNGDSGFISMVSLALTLLFVLIESTPVLAKAFLEFDTYDAALQRAEHDDILDSLAQTRDKHAQVMAPPPMRAAAASATMGNRGTI